MFRPATLRELWGEWHMHSCPVQTTIQPINNTIPEWALFLQAVIQMRQSVQLVPTVPVMALKALCTVEFSMDQLQNLVGHVHAWSKWLEQIFRLVYFECKRYANDLCCEGRLCQQNTVFCQF